MNQPSRTVTHRRRQSAAEKILGVARDLFYRQGIRAIGVDEIVKRAGVTKPSLYRSFPSKDELAASYLRQYDLEFWERFDEAVDAHPGDPRAQIDAFLTRVGKRTQKPDYRGCGMTNAAVEYPEHGHPARVVSEANKQELRRRLRAMATAMGAARCRHARRRAAAADRGRLYQRPVVRARRPGTIGRPQRRPADRGELEEIAFHDTLRRARNGVVRDACPS